MRLVTFARPLSRSEERVRRRQLDVETVLVELGDDLRRVGAGEPPVRRQLQLHRALGLAEVGHDRGGHAGEVVLGRDEQIQAVLLAAPVDETADRLSVFHRGSVVVHGSARWQGPDRNPAFRGKECKTLYRAATARKPGGGAQAAGALSSTVACQSRRSNLDRAPIAGKSNSVPDH